MIWLPRKLSTINAITLTSQWVLAVQQSVECSRRVVDAKMNAFEKLCILLEYSFELYTLSELHNVMVDLASMANCAYSEKHMQRLLVQNCVTTDGWKK